MSTIKSLYTFKGLSIQKRLPLLICILLTSVIVTFGLVSFYGVKKVSVEMGKKRLRSLTDQLGTLFTQSTKTLHTITLAVAAKDTVKKCAQSGGGELKAETAAMLEKFRKDSTWLLAELFDADKKAIVWSGNKGIEKKLSLDTIFSSLAVAPDSCKIGKIYAVGDSMYYPVVATVTANKKITGYIVLWKSFMSNPKGIEQLSQLMGTTAKIYIGNTDGSLYTDLLKTVPKPPVDTAHIGNFIEYKKSNANFIAAAKPISSIPWFVLVEFSEKSILEPAAGFLYWNMIIGIILISVGFIITWIMSRNIIKPLTQLTTAATAIAGGNYDLAVKVDRKDEVGKLANAFNVMAQQIHLSQLDLENKVKERTAQLESANKEMESFTYSVSHDLRAPLRIINGYAQIIKDDAEGFLTEEPRRMLENIMTNAKHMGILIDDLLNFSRLGRRELVTHDTGMESIVQPILTQQLNGSANYNVKMHALPNCYCDSALIKLVWGNLISNAIKYSANKTSPFIEIGSYKENNKNVYFIKDNGAGFDMKYYDKLFGVFQRLHKATEFEGTGVGLALTHRIVSKHGGKIWAESILNEGATFYFTLNC